MGVLATFSCGSCDASESDKAVWLPAHDNWLEGVQGKKIRGMGRIVSALYKQQRKMEQEDKRRVDETGGNCIVGKEAANIRKKADYRNDYS